MKNNILIIDGPNVAMKYISLKGKINVELSFLKHISFLYNKFKPSEIFVCWEGTNSRKPRQNILKEYKANRQKLSNQRRSMKKSRHLDLDKVKRQITLFKIKLFENLPAHQLSVNNLEADDVIAELTRIYKNDNIIIVSADADFKQLLSDNVMIYNHLKKKTQYLTDIKKELGNPFNIIWQKAIVGDKSDNIDGIKGVGLKTFEKMFADYLFFQKRWKPDLIKKVLSRNNKSKHFNDVMKYFKVIQLFTPLHAIASSQVRDYCRANKKYIFNEDVILKYFETFSERKPTGKEIKSVLIPFSEFIMRNIFKKG